jgi:hypothetical protein
VSRLASMAQRTRNVQRLGQDSMNLLLIIAAVIEAVAGTALLLIPTAAVTALLGAPLDTATGLVAARIAGAALVSLAIACWQARNGERGSPATGIIEAMSFYNFAGALVLVYAGTRLELRSALLWPAILLHLGLGAWCVVTLWFTRRKTSRPETT